MESSPRPAPQRPAYRPYCGGTRGRAWTHDAILHAEAQLVLEVWPLDEDRGDRWAADDVELHLRLVLQTLQRT